MYKDVRLLLVIDDLFAYSFNRDMLTDFIVILSNSKMTTNVFDDDDLIDVSSEDDGTTDMATVINNMVNKIKDAPQEQLDKLSKINEQLIQNEMQEFEKKD